MRYGNYIIMALVLVGLFGLNFAAANAAQNIASTLACMFLTVKNALAVGMMLLVVAAAVVYAVGQVLGAETRARASVWATAMFIGAIIGALLYILLPFILKHLFAGDAARITQIDDPTAQADCSSVPQ